ncbi:hypothetical protein GGI42DRAFT_327962 [Trichoderma sp. SZMC 28013]
MYIHERRTFFFFFLAFFPAWAGDVFDVIRRMQGLFFDFCMQMQMQMQMQMRCETTWMGYSTLCLGRERVSLGCVWSITCTSTESVM